MKIQNKYYLNLPQEYREGIKIISIKIKKNNNNHYKI